MASAVALSGVTNASEALSAATIQSGAAEIIAKGKETVKLRFAGRIHLDYNSLSNDGADISGDEPETTNAFFFRRLRLGVKADLTEGIEAETIYDFSEGGGGTANTIVIRIGDFTLGHQKTPFGHAQWQSSSEIKTIERSVATRFFVDDTGFAGFHTGIHYETQLSDFTVRAAITNSSAGTDDIRNATQDLAYYASVRWQHDDLTLGADFGHQQSNDTLGTGEDDFSAVTAYVNYQNDNFTILGEYFYGDGDDADTDAFAILAAYKFGKFEPVLRYSFVDSDAPIDSDNLIRRAPEALNNTDVAGEIYSIYAGVNYYHNDAVKASLGYEYAESENEDGETTDEISGIRARIQVLF